MMSGRSLFSSFFLFVAIALCCANHSNASIATGGGGGGGPLAGLRNAVVGTDHSRSNAIVRRRNRSAWCAPIEKARVSGRGYAAVIPGNSFTEEVVVGGVLNFLSIYNILIAGRVILSWIPQLQGVQALQPVYLLTDPYLNAFRRLNLTFGGLDFSVLPAFLLLSFATNAVASLGAEMPDGMKGGAKWWHARKAGLAAHSRRFNPHAVTKDATSEQDASPRRHLIAFR